MEELNPPATLAMPFANNGTKNDIPTQPTGTNKASLTEGFPIITSTPSDQGGIPPARADFNGVMNLNSQFYFAFQNGWLPTFNPSVSQAIGGYPLGAKLWYVDAQGGVNMLVSLKGNNTDNFISNPSFIGTSWRPVLVTQDYVVQNYVNKAGDTMTGNLTISNDKRIIIDTTLDRDVSPGDTAIYRGAVSIRDKNNKIIGLLESTQRTDKTITCQIGTQHTVDGVTKYGSLGVSIKSDGYTYGYAPQTPDTANSTEIVTANFGNNKYVKKVGDTMSGQLVMANGSNGIRFNGTNDNYYYVTAAGNFFINAKTTGKGFLISPAGELYYNNGTSNLRLLNTSDQTTIINTAFPNYSAGVAISSGTVLSFNALVIAKGSPGSFSSIILYADGQEIWAGGVSENTARPRAGGAYCPKGTTITATNATTITAYPMK